MGLGGQPSTEHFENLLYQKVSALAEHQVIWVEDESRRVGDVFVPEFFHHALRHSPVVAIRVSEEERIANIVEEYAAQPDVELLEAVGLLKKRLGGQAAAQASELILQGRYAEVVTILLPYYDKLYRYGLGKRISESVEQVALEDLSRFDRIHLLSGIRAKWQKIFFG